MVKVPLLGKLSKHVVGKLGMMDSIVKCYFWTILRGITGQSICEKHLLPWFIFYLEIIILQPE